jgi:tetratricopeptide (TPR) repeat protein
MTTLFEVLGVPRDATDEAVRIAFRKAAKAHHPDLNLGDPAAEPQLRQVIAAYKALKTAPQRAVYNEYLAKEEQYWRSLARRNENKDEKKRSFAVPVVAGLVSGGAVALAVWVSLSLSFRQEKSETRQAARVTLTISQTPSQQVDVAAESNRLGKQDGSGQPLETRAAPTASPAGDSQHLPQSAGNASPTSDQPEQPLPLARELEQVLASADRTPIRDVDQRGPDSSESGAASKAAKSIDAAQDAALQAPGIDAIGRATHAADLALAKEKGKAISRDEDRVEDKGSLHDLAFYLVRGERWSREGDFDRAMVDFDEAIRLRPDSALAYHLRGNAWSSKGELARALADYEVAISLDPNNPVLYRDRGILWHRRGEPDRALVDLDHAVRLGFSDAGAYNARGLVWYEKQRYERAIADFNQALRIDPKLASALVNRGNAFRSKGDLASATADFDQAVSLDPNMAAAARNGALARSDKNDSGQAVPEHVKERDVSPERQR